MLHLLMVFSFVFMSLLCVAFVSLLVITGIAWKSGAALPRSMAAFYAFTLIGMVLSVSSSYWKAFGAQPSHPALPDITRLCGLAAYAVAFVVVWRPLKPTLSAFVAANGGTPGAALGSALLHPHLSLARMAGRVPKLPQ